MQARIAALLIGILALAALRAQFDALPAPMSGWPLPEKLWLMAGFFTILTNLLLAAHLFAVARKWPMPASRAANLLVSALMVMLTYHLLLARLWAPQGLAWWADQGLHTAVPLAYLAWWLAFARKDVTAADLPKWLVYPGAYAVYALIRGALTGFYPYPFLNAAALGPALLVLNLALMLAAFALTGLGVLALARRLNRSA
jgi:hypothetical protein